MVLESGGLPVEVVAVWSALPSSRTSEHLESVAGAPRVRWDQLREDLQPILSGRLLPKTKTSASQLEDADDIAAVVVNSPIIERIETLDLSSGSSPTSAQRFCSLPEGGSLQKVSIDDNDVGKDLIKQLNGLKISIDTSNPRPWTKTMSGVLLQSENDRRLCVVGNPEIAASATFKAPPRGSASMARFASVAKLLIDPPAALARLHTAALVRLDSPGERRCSPSPQPPRRRLRASGVW